MDSTGSLVANAHGVSTVFLFIKTDAGTLPVGVIVLCGSESRAALTAGFELHRSLLNEQHIRTKVFFYGGVGSGFKVAMSDNSDALHQAMADVWVFIQLLCIFHICKQVVKWLKTTGSQAGHMSVPQQAECLQFVRRLMYLHREREYACTGHLTYAGTLSLTVRLPKGESQRTLLRRR